MKKSFLLFFSTFFLNHCFSSNLIVQQSGPAGTYSSINAAISAALDGDVILVNNRTDGLPWIEDVIINKSLTFVSAVDNVSFWVSGNYEIVRANNRLITIVGMRNTSLANNLFVSGSIPTQRTILKLSQCEFSGSVYGSGLANDSQIGGTTTSIYASKFQKIVKLSFGGVFGSEFSALLELQNDPMSTNDTLHLVGNKITSNSGFNSLYNLNQSQVVIIENCIVNKQGNSNSQSFSAILSNSPKVGSRITNCTLYCNNSGTFSAAYALAGWDQIVENSILRGRQITNLSLCFYNLAYSTENLPSANGNVAGTMPVINFIDLTYTDNVSVINLGNPSNASLDLDLSRNNIGVYGGSYNINNFHPINTINSSVINMVEIPKLVNQGQTLNLKAIATDK